MMPIECIVEYLKYATNKENIRHIVERTLALSPESKEFYAIAGEKMRDIDEDKSRELLEKSISLGNHDPETIITLMDVYLSSDLDHRATQLLNILLDSEDIDEDVLLSAGDLFSKYGHLGKALLLYKRVLKKHRRRDIFQKIIDIYKKQGDIDRVLEYERLMSEPEGDVNEPVPAKKNSK